MGCQHKHEDPNCSSSPEGRLRYELEMEQQRVEDEKQYLKTVKYYQDRVAELETKLKGWEAMTGNDYGSYTIISNTWENGYLILTVQYPSCKGCSFEAKKILVIELENPMDALYWKRIDPHFRETPPKNRTEAPSPVARFPASDEGMINALKFVRSLQ